MAKLKLNNKYYILRHGEAISNVKNINSSWPEKFINPLTPNGRKQIKASLDKLKGKHIDMIISSDLLRTKQTANIIGRSFKLKIKFDKRLREISFGNFNGKSIESEYLFYKALLEKKVRNFDKGETYESVLERIEKFIKDIDKKYKGKHILIVSHQCPLWILETYVNGFSLSHSLKKIPKEARIKRGELRELN